MGKIPQTAAALEEIMDARKLSRDVFHVEEKSFCISLVCARRDFAGALTDHCYPRIFLAAVHLWNFAMDLCIRAYLYVVYLRYVLPYFPQGQYLALWNALHMVLHARIGLAATVCHFDTT